ncbi:MAG: ribose-phosphate pyrophosphokinase [Ruminococcus sp.]|nr:ribose-phosphate pyrophosphokinase [Ruminococcus sp.]
MISIKYKKFYYPEVYTYPDGTFRVNIPEIPVTDNQPIEVVWTYRKEHDLTLLVYITENLKENYKNPINLYMPYVPNARMDRVKEKNEVFTLKYFCKVINFLEFDSVKILDVHSPVGSALLERCENISPLNYINSAIQRAGINLESDYIFFPDESSFKRYFEYFKDFNNIGFGIKQRDWKTGKIIGLDIFGDSPENKRVILIDDICSYGGTAYHSAKKLKTLGCKDINLYFTHCENSIYQGELLKGDLINHIYTTNSVFDGGSSGKITVFDCI